MSIKSLTKRLSINSILTYVETRILKRRTPGSLRINSRTIFFPDRLVAAWQYQEMFVDESYYFESKNKAPIIIDCGSNFGMSVLYFKLLYPTSRVLCFEPLPQNFDLLKKNTAAFEDVQCHQAACWIKDENLDFFVGASDECSLTQKTPNRIRVNALDMERVLARFDEIDFLKIDIEGAEFELLPHIESVLHKVKSLFVEVHFRKEAPTQLSGVLSLLERNGYRYTIERVDKSVRPLAILSSQSVQFNIYATRVQYDAI